MWNRGLINVVLSKIQHYEYGYGLVTSVFGNIGVACVNMIYKDHLSVIKR